ncbi:NAD(P)-dependent oxidoreductase [Streptomyces sp. NPDC001978]|uniref:NAD(P)-dependent oxidoreductase n=1 Tax=Streptomyces sp. NPDC001978 TaxID=3364627 RepID=UPI0036B7B2C5
MSGQPSVGFVGLGTMGRPMAGRVLDAGFPLTVFDVNPANMADLARSGATVASSLGELARACDVVMVAVVNDAQVRGVMDGDGGVLAAARPGTVVLVHSTVHPDLCGELTEAGAARGLVVLDAPMTGSPDAAARGALSMMVGGDKAATERVRPVLEAIATHVTHLGAAGSGQLAKIANNLAIAVTMRAIDEALAFATSYSIDRETMLSLLVSGGADSWVARNWSAIGGTTRNYPGGAKGLADLTHKDVSLALALAHRNDVAVPTAAVASQFLLDAYKSAQASVATESPATLA